MQKVITAVTAGVAFLVIATLIGCESLHKNSTLIETIPVGMVTTTMEGKITYANPAYQKMLGYTLNELKNITYQQLTPRKWHEMEEKMVTRAGKGSYVYFEKEYIRKDGKTIPIAITGWVFKDKDGKPTGTGSLVIEVEKK